MIVKDNTIQAEGLDSFLKNLGKMSAEVDKKLATNVLKNPGRALEIEANFAAAAASRKSKILFSTLLEVINFYHKGKFLKNILEKTN